MDKCFLITGGSEVLLGDHHPWTASQESGQSLMLDCKTLLHYSPKSCHKTELLIANFNYKPQIYFHPAQAREKRDIGRNKSSKSNSSLNSSNICDSLFSKEGFP